MWVLCEHLLAQAVERLGPGSSWLPGPHPYHSFWDSAELCIILTTDFSFSTARYIMASLGMDIEEKCSSFSEVG